MKTPTHPAELTKPGDALDRRRIRASASDVESPAPAPAVPILLPLARGTGFLLAGDEVRFYFYDADGRGFTL